MQVHLRLIPPHKPRSLWNSKAGAKILTHLREASEGRVRLEREFSDKLRQRWAYKQRQAIFKGIRWAALTCDAHLAITFIPDTHITATSTTTGLNSKFIHSELLAYTKCALLVTLLSHAQSLSSSTYFREGAP